MNLEMDPEMELLPDKWLRLDGGGAGDGSRDGVDPPSAQVRQRWSQTWS